jgi:hypothetical protein
VIGDVLAIGLGAGGRARGAVDRPPALWPALVSGRELWRMARPQSLVDLTVRVERDQPLPELCVIVSHGGDRPGWVESRIHLSWAEAHTLAEALTDWLWRTQPQGPEGPPPSRVLEP